MKYKHIPSMVHNFTDSFVSLVNYAEGGYVMDILENFLLSSGGTLKVNWLPDLEVSRSELPEGLMKAFVGYADWLPSLAGSMRVDLSMISTIYTIFTLERERVKAETVSIDNRGITVTGRAKFWE